MRSLLSRGGQIPPCAREARAPAGLTSRAPVLVRLLLPPSCNDASRVPRRSMHLHTLLLTPESPEKNAALRALALRPCSRPCPLLP